MNTRCSFAGCGSFALNIAPASGLCDVHFYKVQRDELLSCVQKYDLPFTDDKQARAEFGDAAVERELFRRAAIAKAEGGAA
jgi:hypothetical protein